MYRTGLFIVIATVIIMVAIGIGGYLIGRSHNRTDLRTGQEQGGAAEFNQRIEDSQRQRLGDIRDDIGAVESLRAIALERDRTYQKLGELNSGSGDLSRQIREQAMVLADFVRYVDRVLSDYDNSTD